MGTDNVFGTASNGDSVRLTAGMVVRLNGNKTIVRAQADSPPNLQGLCGVVLSGSVAPGSPVNTVMESFRQPVLLETGLTPIAKQTLYVSATVAGCATNVAPANAVAIGTIEDVANYATTSQVFAALSILPSIAGGAQGAQGAQGSQGATGTGSQGAQGAQGAQGSQGAQGAQANTPIVYTATVDLMTPGFYNFNTPLVAGKKFIFITGRLLIQTRDASLTTGPTLLLAQNGVDSSQAVALSTANINSQAAPTNISATWTISGGLPDMTTNPMQLHVSVAAAGAGLTTCTGTFYLTAIYA